MFVKIFRSIASLVTVVGLAMLVLLIQRWMAGTVAQTYFQSLDYSNAKAMLLALPVPLHIIFIGLIVQKKHFTPQWQRFAWIGITSSGIWLGISLLVRTFWS